MRKDHPYISRFVDMLEPACDAFAAHRYGQMFEALDAGRPHLRRPADKQRWSASMTTLEELRADGTVADVLTHLHAARRPHLPDAIADRERELAAAEFENVLVIVGRGWNLYKFNEMLELTSAPAVSLARQQAFERNRNLFYVACSRPQRHLTLLFTQLLRPQALDTLGRWFGTDNLEALAL